MRKLHFKGDRVWEYRFGKQYIVFCSPERRRYSFLISQILGCSPDSFERAAWKGSPMQVLPSMLKVFLFRQGLEVV